MTRLKDTKDVFVFIVICIDIYRTLENPYIDAFSRYSGVAKYIQQTPTRAKK